MFVSVMYEKRKKNIEVLNLKFFPFYLFKLIEETVTVMIRKERICADFPNQ